jgi:hypothetical protein
MIFIPKTRFTGKNLQSITDLGNCRRVFPSLLSFLVLTYYLSQFYPVMANSPGEKTTGENKQICSNNIEEKHQQMSLLTNRVIEASTWVGDPGLGLKAAIITLGSQLFSNTSITEDTKSSAKSNNKLVTHKIIAQRTVAPLWQKTILPLLNPNPGFQFTNSVNKINTTINGIDLILISGGKPITIHADSRYQLPEIVAKSKTNAVAAVDGTFFSLKFLTSNTMIGPVLSQVSNKFIPGNNGENKKLNGRPLVLISSNAVRYIPFKADKHNTFAGIRQEMADVTDAFVAGAWLVKDGQPLPPSSFKTLFGAEVARHRAFWGVNNFGAPTIGISTKPVTSANLAVILTKAGLKDSVMLDSGASTSLTYKGESLVGYIPRPVPHAVALVSPNLCESS